MKKTLTVFIVEDDELMTEFYKEDVEEWPKRWDVQFFESALDVTKSGVEPDIIFLDMAAGHGCLDTALANVESVNAKFRNARIFAFSAVDFAAKAVIDEVIRTVKDAGLWISFMDRDRDYWRWAIEAYEKKTGGGT